MRRPTSWLTIALLFASGVEAQSPIQVERLAALGKVWGFLKYSHRGIATGSADWDSALVAAMPKVNNARTDDEFRVAIRELLDLGGPVAPCPRTCVREFSGLARRNSDLRWARDTKLFGTAIVDQFDRIRNKPHSGRSRYVTYTGIGTVTFERDTAFSAPEYPGEAQRLLSLFRFWNAVRYYFPYLYVNGGDWNTVLPEFIPRLVGAKDALEYHLVIAELTARVNDAHVSASSETLTGFLGSRFPNFEARFIENRVVVWKSPDTSAAGLRVGDVITHINGEPVAERQKALTRYVAAGNEAVLGRKVLHLMLRDRTDSASYTVERDGTSIAIRVATVPMPATRETPFIEVSDLVRVLPNTNIAYVDMGGLDTSQMADAIALLGYTDGLVLDVRNYPRGTMHAWARFLNLEPQLFARFTRPDPAYPGHWISDLPILIGGSPYTVGARMNQFGQPMNPDHYRGRVAILGDERTQSHAEFTMMALRTSPRNKVIGSQTAGADGNVTYLALPGGIRTVFTGLGVYYPNGTPTQRVGIVPDIVIRPTIAGVRAGRDEVLERAIAYITTGK